ncbi:MAG: rod shape-determining protein MreC [Alphaproteobacteria bacterium]|nr:rod shape-determining protein MreC [Alphaproteobacteria bacterium]
MSLQRPQKPAIKSVPLKTVTVRATPAVLILLSLTLMVLHRAGTLPVERLRTAVMDVTAPVLAAVSAPVEGLVDNISGVASLQDLKAENARLRAENARLQKWYEAALEMKAENESFRQLLNVKADPAMSFVTARVVSDAGGTFVKSVLLPVGARDHVQRDSAVLSGQGLVGRVVEVGADASRVLLITDLNSDIPVIVQGTRIKAILAGKNGDLMKLERLPPDSGMTVGTQVATSGDGGQLPAGLPVGTIVSVSAQGVWVKPLADLDRLVYVQVVNAALNPALATGDIAPQDGQ